MIPTMYIARIVPSARLVPLEFTAKQLHVENIHIMVISGRISPAWDTIPTMYIARIVPSRK